MTNEITNGMLLEHIQAMRNDLQNQIQASKTNLQVEIQGLKTDLQVEVQGLKTDLQGEIQVTKKDLLGHLQAMKNDLQNQLYSLDRKYNGLDGKLASFEAKMERGFIEAREHRQAIQEDLDATIRMVAKHDKKLARIK